MSEQRCRLAIIGLDGATWDQALPLMEAGKLPNIERITSAGARGRLRSTIPPVTSVAWTSMYTGVEPREHGILAMQSYDPVHRRWRPVCRSDSRVAPFWKDFNRRGLSVGLLCLPFTYPPEPLDGWMISGIMGTPEYGPTMFSSPALYEQVTKACGKTDLVSLTKVHPSRRRATLGQQAQWLEDASAYLLEHHPVDVFFVVENYTDHIQHSYLQARKWEHPGETGDPVEDAYIHADRLVGRIEQCVGPETPIVLLSDHGHTPCRGLINTGRINTRFPVSGNGAGDLRLVRPAVRRGAKRMLRSWAGVLAGALRAAAPSSSYERLKQRLAASPLRSLFSVEQTADSALIRWPGAFGEAYWSVDYEENRDALAKLKPEIITALRELRFPDRDEPLFEVYDGLELYGAEGPDVPFAVCFPAPGYVTGPMGADASLVLSYEETARQLVFKKEGWQGTHQMEGIVGANAAALARIGKLPTAISGMLQALREVLDLPYAEPERVSSGGCATEKLSEADIEAMEGRLRDLGYMG